MGIYGSPVWPEISSGQCQTYDFDFTLLKRELEEKSAINKTGKTRALNTQPRRETTMHKEAFANLAINDNKYTIRIEDYLVSDAVQEDDRWMRYDSVEQTVREPQICIWVYMQKSDVVQLLNMKRNTQMKKFIDSYLAKTHPRGYARIVFRELIYNSTKFCKTSGFDSTQSSVVLSQFYLTHLYFTNHLEIGAQKVYLYFKELQMCHSLPFPPVKMKLFDLEETKKVLMFFVKIYLRNLPLIRFLSLPNFALSTTYKLEPDLKLKKKSKKGDKKAKKKKKKK